MVDNLLQCFTFPPTQHTVSFETKSPIALSLPVLTFLVSHAYDTEGLECLFGVSLVLLEISLHIVSQLVRAL